MSTAVGVLTDMELDSAVLGSWVSHIIAVLGACSLGFSVICGASTLTSHIPHPHPHPHPHLQVRTRRWCSP